MTEISITQAPIRLSYRVSVRSLHAHLFAVALRIDKPAAQQRVSLPVWIAGSYLVREFSKHLQGLRAHQGEVSAASAGGRTVFTLRFPY